MYGMLMFYQSVFGNYTKSCVYGVSLRDRNRIVQARRMDRRRIKTKGKKKRSTGPGRVGRSITSLYI